MYCRSGTKWPSSYSCWSSFRRAHGYKRSSLVGPASLRLDSCRRESQIRRGGRENILAALKRTKWTISGGGGNDLDMTARILARERFAGLFDWAAPTAKARRCLTFARKRHLSSYRGASPKRLSHNQKPVSACRTGARSNFPLTDRNSNTGRRPARAL